MDKLPVYFATAERRLGPDVITIPAVAIRATAHNCHHVPATGQRHGMHLRRIEGDPAGRAPGLPDVHGALVQVGALPEPTPPAGVGASQ
jgi:hypothetical protein